MTYSEWLHPAYASCLWLDALLLLTSCFLNIFFPSDFRRLFASIRDGILRDRFANVLMMGGMLAVLFTMLTCILQQSATYMLKFAIPLFAALIPVMTLFPKLRDWLSSGCRLRMMVFVTWSAVGSALLFTFFSYIGWLPFTSQSFRHADSFVTLTHPFDSLFGIWESGMLYAEEVALVFAAYATFRLLNMIYSTLK